MVKLAGAIVVCAVAAFAAAFFAAGAGKSSTARLTTHHTVVPFADSAARAVAVSFAGHPAALELPPPRHKHHAKRAVIAAPVAVTPTPTPTASAPAYSPAPAPPRHKSGVGHGVTTIGP